VFVLFAHAVVTALAVLRAVSGAFLTVAYAVAAVIVGARGDWALPAVRRAEKTRLKTPERVADAISTRACNAVFPARCPVLGTTAVAITALARIARRSSTSDGSAVCRAVAPILALRITHAIAAKRWVTSRIGALAAVGRAGVTLFITPGLALVIAAYAHGDYTILWTGFWLVASAPPITALTRKAWEKGTGYLAAILRAGTRVLAPGIANAIAARFGELTWRCGSTTVFRARRGGLVTETPPITALPGVTRHRHGSIFGAILRTSAYVLAFQVAHAITALAGTRARAVLRATPAVLQAARIAHTVATRTRRIRWAVLWAGAKVLAADAHTIAAFTRKPRRYAGGILTAVLRAGAEVLALRIADTVTAEWLAFTLAAVAGARLAVLATHAVAVAALMREPRGTAIRRTTTGILTFQFTGPIAAFARIAARPTVLPTGLAVLAAVIVAYAIAASIVGAVFFAHAILWASVAVFVAKA
jgi:hypothetical protein